MAEYRKPQPLHWVWFSPWLIIGCVGVLAAVLLILAIKNSHREKQFMEEMLLSQAHVLMRGIEAGSRTGSMGMGWGHRQVQLLLEETADQPGVLYMAILDSGGKVLAHNDPLAIGKRFSIAIPSSGTTSQRFSDESEHAFEVIRQYQPWMREGGGRGARRGVCENWSLPEPGREQYILVGMDARPFDEARSQDLRQTFFLSGTMLLMGAAGIVSLFWAQHYRIARRSLKNMEVFTETIVQQMPVGLIAADLQGRIQRANEAAVHILGHERRISESLAQYPCFLPVAASLRQQESVVEEEVYHAAGGGKPLPLLINGSVIRDERGRVQGQVFLFSDISRIRGLEEKLRRSERLASIGRLAEGIAHEVRNPLSSIKGFATILARRADGDDRSRHLADVMIQEVERLNRVVTELLEYARPAELGKRIVSCRELIDQAFQLVRAEADGKEISLRASVEPEDLGLFVDPDRFVQILLNLFLNGLQAMETGGVLSVEADHRGTDVRVCVGDTGKGISPEHLPHLFDPYFTTKPGGVGLGLANVHKLVEAHGGKIEAQSTPEKGTRFIMHFPVEFLAAPRGSAEAVPSEEARP